MNPGPTALEANHYTIDVASITRNMAQTVIGRTAFPLCSNFNRLIFNKVVI